LAARNQFGVAAVLVQRVQGLRQGLNSDVVKGCGFHAQALSLHNLLFLTQDSFGCRGSFDPLLDLCKTVYFTDFEENSHPCKKSKAYVR
jgi:hypothetical protein